jgi:hypothetical protein
MLAVAHTMGVVTFSLYTLFFSIATKDERRTAFSLDTFSDKTFNIATGVSILTLLLATVFGPLEAFLQATSLDVRQWLICIGVALSIIVVSEIRKAVRRPTAAKAIPAGAVPPVAAGGCLVNAALLRGDKTRHPPAAGITPGRVPARQGRSNRIWKPARTRREQAAVTCHDRPARSEL